MTIDGQGWWDRESREDARWRQTGRLLAGGIIVPRHDGNDLMIPPRSDSSYLRSRTDLSGQGRGDMGQEFHP
jgi:hypothetical protein